MAMFLLTASWTMMPMPAASTFCCRAYSCPPLTASELSTDTSPSSRLVILAFAPIAPVSASMPPRVMVSLLVVSYTTNGVDTTPDSPSPGSVGAVMFRPAALSCATLTASVSSKPALTLVIQRSLSTVPTDTVLARSAMEPWPMAVALATLSSTMAPVPMAVECAALLPTDARVPTAIEAKEFWPTDDWPPIATDSKAPLWRIALSPMATPSATPAATFEPEPIAMALIAPSPTEAAATGTGVVPPFGCSTTRPVAGSTATEFEPRAMAPSALLATEAFVPMAIELLALAVLMAPMAVTARPVAWAVSPIAMEELPLTTE